MSKKNTEFDKEFALTAFGGLVGLILIILVGTLMVFWSDNKSEYYSDNPDFVPGTYLLYGILILLPLLIYASMIMIKGLITIGGELIKRSQTTS